MLISGGYVNGIPLKRIYSYGELVFDNIHVPPLAPDAVFDLTTSIPSESNLTFTRNTAATYFDGSKWRSVANNVPRFHYVNGYTGLLIEPSTTNRMTSRNANPTDTTGWTVGGDEAGVVSAAAAPVGSIAAAGLDVLNTNGNALKIDASAASGEVTVTSTGQATTTNRVVVSAFVYVVSGSAMLSRTGTGTPEILIINANDGFVRHALSITPSATTDNFVISVEAGGVAYVLLEQMEENGLRDRDGNPIPSSPIVTNAAIAFRGLDTLQDASLNTRPYFTEVSGAFAMEVVNMAFSSSMQYPFAISRTTNNQNFISARLNNDNGFYRRVIFVDTVSQTQTATHKPRLNVPYPVALSWKSDETTLCAGYDSLIEPATAMPTGLTLLRLGSQASGGNPFFGLIRSIAFWTSYTSRYDMQAEMFSHNALNAIACAGQSNVYGYFRAQIDQDNTGETNAIAVMDENVEAEGLNVLLNCATNGSLAFKQNPNPATDVWWCTLGDDGETLTLDGNAWEKFDHCARAFKYTENNLLSIIWGQGDGGINEGERVVFRAATDMIFAGMREIFPDAQIVIDPVGRYIQDPELNRTQPVRDVHHAMAEEEAGIIYGPEKAHLPIDDYVHLDDVTGYGVQAPHVVSRALGLPGFDGPAITSVTRTGTTVTIGITHDGGTDINFNDNAGNFFRYYDGDTPVTITGAAKVNATTITLTLDSAPDGSNTETLYHIYNICYQDDITKAITDNSPGGLMLRSYTGEVEVIAVPAPVLESFGVGSEIGGVTSHTTPAPAGIQDGDLLIHLASLKHSAVGLADFTPPAGFEEIGTPVNSSATNLRISAKIASGESGNYIFTTGAVTQSASQMWRISGAGTIEAIQVAFAAASSRNLLNSAPSVDVTVVNSLGIRACSRERGGAEVLNCPDTLVAVVSSNPTGTGLSELTIGASEEVFDAIGASGSADFTWPSLTSYSVCATVVIPPAE